MKRATIWLICLFATLYAKPLPAPTDVGVGGDIVYCEEHPDSEFKGYYFLDYLVRLIHYPFEFGPFEKHVITVQNRLYSKAPAFYPPFREFVDAYLNETGSSKYRWIRENVLEEIPDEAISSHEHVPKNCLKPDGSINKFQAVIRKKVGDTFEFRYDGKLLDQLKNQKNTEQLAFLLLHEFFWNYSETAWRVRLAIKALYFYAHDAEQLQAWLVGWSKIDVDPSFGGDTRSVRFYPKSTKKTHNVTFDSDIGKHQLLLYNDLPTTVTLYDAKEKVALTIAAGSVGRLVYPRMSQSIEFVYKARDSAGAEFTIKVEASGFGKIID